MFLVIIGKTLSWRLHRVMWSPAIPLMKPSHAILWHFVYTVEILCLFTWWGSLSMDAVDWPVDSEYQCLWWWVRFLRGKSLHPQGDRRLSVSVLHTQEFASHLSAAALHTPPLWWPTVFPKYVNSNLSTLTFQSEGFYVPSSETCKCDLKERLGPFPF